MDDDQQFCLRWNNHQSTLISVFDTLLENETLVDCTLAAEGRFMKAHKVVLSACSPYFATLLQQQYDKHPIFILKDVKYQELRAMMDYMYRGEVNISQDQLAALLKAAESLQIKGLSDNRSGSGAGSAPRQEIPHQRASIPGGKHGYTLEQTKRARLGPGSGIEQQEIVSGSREGSSSPSRRRRKPRRRSIDNDVHDNSNSSANQQPNASLAGSAITASALASQMTAAAAAAAAASAVVSPAALASAVVSSQQQSGTQQQQAQLTTNVPKKTETIKGTTSDAMNNENIQATTSGTAIVGSGAAGVVIGSGAATATGGDEQDIADKVEQKSNHKQKSSNIGKDASTIPSGELTIEPKSEYDDEGNDENVEDLTLDEEEMGMDDLDHNAGTSQGGEGSSQGYAAWQHDNRSQDELLLTTQDAQQRDPQDIQVSISTLEQQQLADEANQTSAAQSAESQAESRIRVRNWLMLADQSILDKSSTKSGKKDKQLSTTKNGSAGTVASAAAVAATNNNNSTTVAITSTSPTGNSQSTIITANSQQQQQQTVTTTATGSNATSTLPTLQHDPKTQRMTRIGSIGRTTIACITPAGESLNNSNVGMVSAAALAAAGVELDTVDDSMTEVIVKLENTASSMNDEDETTEQMDEHNFEYDLKLSSPMSWAYDTIKIENEDEEFEDILAGENDNNTEDDDDLLTTAAATTKHTAVHAQANGNGRQDQSGIMRVVKSTGGMMKIRASGKKPVLTAQQTQQFLEQQQHLQHLQLQPTMQMKLPTIAATISAIGPNAVGGAGGNPSASGTAGPSHKQLNLEMSQKNAADFHSSLSEDKRYRILVQNQRMRKESLEHSADMIYNADIEKPWVCRNCNRNYKWKNSLKCHLKNECGQPPRYFCSKLCGYATNVHSNLKRHLNTKCRDRLEEEQQAKQKNTYTIVFDKE